MTESKKSSQVSLEPIDLETIQVKPLSFSSHSFALRHTYNKPLQSCWDTFNHSDTFTKHQVFPFKVEFCPFDASISNQFKESVWTNHHGPLLNVAGKIKSIKEPYYRDLHYTYGSYAISFRLLRPVRLQFLFEALTENQTQVTVQFDSYCKPWISSLWSGAQFIFWKLFFISLTKSIKN